jgi:hypothetical protein
MVDDPDQRRKIEHVRGGIIARATGKLIAVGVVAVERPRAFIRNG